MDGRLSLKLLQSFVQFVDERRAESIESFGAIESYCEDLDAVFKKELSEGRRGRELN